MTKFYICIYIHIYIYIHPVMLLEGNGLLFFFCSMGGLVVKQMLDKAKTENVDNLVKNTIGVVCFTSITKFLRFHFHLLLNYCSEMIIMVLFLISGVLQLSTLRKQTCRRAVENGTGLAPCSKCKYMIFIDCVICFLFSLCCDNCLFLETQ